MSACGVRHPIHIRVGCLASQQNHPVHYAFVGLDEGDVEWVNDLYEPPPSKEKMSVADAAERLKNLADQVPPRQKSGDQNKAEGQMRAEQGSDPLWGGRFDTCLRELSEVNARFTSEDITAVVGMPPGHPSAVGARMTKAAKAGLIVEVGMVKARRSNQNSAKIAQWLGTKWETREAEALSDLI